MYRLLVSFTVITDIYRSFIPNKTYIKWVMSYSVHFKAPLDSWIPLSKVVPG